MPTVNTEVPLKEGLKRMFAALAASYMLAIKLQDIQHDDEAWMEHENEIVESFIAGLFNNGYEIRELEEA